MTAPAPFPADALDRFARQVESGTITFFVGAGFSLDSEGNSAPRLIRRLLARAIALYLVAANLARERQCTEDLATLRKLKATFRTALKLGKHPIRSKAILDALAREYYPANDWLCTAMGQVYGLILELSPRTGPDKASLDEIERLENLLLRWLGTRLGKGDRPIAPDAVPILRLDPAILKPLAQESRGKVLFLEAMGFNCRQIMAGDLDASQTPDALARSFGGRIRRRHHVLARLAREGLSSHLLTTNFDLLLEGAYRIAGFQPAGPASGTAVPLPETRTARFARIVGPTDFAEKANSRCPVALVKIHGCADRYRSQRKGGKVDRWKALLDSIVFTYREVQNWRKDAWSRDLVYTLVRSRVVAFLGYSTADPVVHDTFRNAYEEMALQTDGPRHKSDPGDAPAFFFSGAAEREFHGIEILRAASRAAGVSDLGVHDHPNYVGFHLLGSGFPSLDESLAWVFHRVYRLRQQTALRSSLRGVLSGLCGGPVRQSWVNAIIADFDRLVEAERQLAGGWSNKATDRPVFERVVGWTETFHPMLLRCFAMAEMVIAHGGPQSHLGRTRTQPWYYPAGEDFALTAWGAVVELAVRRRVAVEGGWDFTALAGGLKGEPWIRAVAAEWPTLDISPGGGRPLPLRLEIRYDGFLRAVHRAPAPAPLSRTVQWNLPFSDLPWPRAAQSGAPFPAAAVLVDWARGALVPCDGRIDLNLSGPSGSASHAA